MRIYYFLVPLITLFFSACSSPQPITYKYFEKEKSVYIAGTYSSDEDEASEVTNLAIFLKKSAEIFQKEGIKYFTIENDNIPKILNNFKSFVLYCYPDNAGYKPSDFENKSTSLERKCKTFVVLKTNGTVYYPDDNKLVLALKGTNKLQMAKPTWSVKDVLNDPEIQRYIDEGLKEGNNRKIKFIEDVNGRGKFYTAKYYRSKYMESLF